jgi:CheY-like chemotaxis protein
MTAQKRILIVVKDSEITTTVSNMLEKANYLVSTANTISQATEMLRSTKFDLMLLDVIFQDATGLDLATLISKNPGKFDNVPFIFYTNIGGDLAIEKYVEVGSSGVIMMSEADETIIVNSVNNFFSQKGLIFVPANLRELLNKSQLENEIRINPKTKKSGSRTNVIGIIVTIGLICIGLYIAVEAIKYISYVYQDQVVERDDWTLFIYNNPQLEGDPNKEVHTDSKQNCLQLGYSAINNYQSFECGRGCEKDYMISVCNEFCDMNGDCSR